MYSIKNGSMICLYLIAIIFISKFVVGNMQATRETKNWQEQDAVVTSSSVVRRSSYRERSENCAVIKIAFEYKGESATSNLELQDNCDYFFSLINSSNDQVNHYPKGTKIQVLVNPKDPMITRSIDFSQRNPPYLYIFLDSALILYLVKKLLRLE